MQGAFADASSYAAVILELSADGLRVVARAVPNRSLIGDAAYMASVVRQIDGPVVPVGHSYGGAVITVAGIQDNVRALVYLSAGPSTSASTTTGLPLRRAGPAGRRGPTRRCPRLVPPAARRRAANTGSRLAKATGPPRTTEEREVESGRQADEAVTVA